MITIKDNTGTSTIHITNVNGGQDNVPYELYEYEIGRINDKIDNFDELNNLIPRETVEAELYKIKNKMF